MIRVISKTKETAQIVLINGGKSKNKHLKWNKVKGRYEDSKGLPFFIPKA